MRFIGLFSNMRWFDYCFLVEKQSRQIQLCSKVPPSRKRNFFGGLHFCALFVLIYMITENEEVYNHLFIAMSLWPHIGSHARQFTFRRANLVNNIIFVVQAQADLAITIPTRRATWWRRQKWSTLIGALSLVPLFVFINLIDPGDPWEWEKLCKGPSLS